MKDCKDEVGIYQSPNQDSFLEPEINIHQSWKFWACLVASPVWIVAGLWLVFGGFLSAVFEGPPIWMNPYFMIGQRLAIDGFILNVIAHNVFKKP